MALKDIIKTKETEGRQEVSEERARACLSSLRDLVSFYRFYPDIFIDDIKGPDCIFKFYWYQRMFLRIAMRYKWNYSTYPRAYSKSFLIMMSLMLKCILYPGTKASVTTAGKEQAAMITLQKVEEICGLIPALANEINFERGKTQKSKNSVKYVFKNGSILDILAANERSRGQRRNTIVIEEAILIDGDILNEVIIPTTNVDRLLADGSIQREEIVNKGQSYVTSAGWGNTFAYEKLLDTLMASLIEPENYYVAGGTWEIPVKEGLLEEDFVDKLRAEGSYSDSSFEREYGSVWSRDSGDAYFSSELFSKHRKLQKAETENTLKTSKNGYYVLGIDVGRTGCNTEVAVIKVTPQPKGTSIKSLVNIYSIEAENFEKQALELKRLFYKFKARSMAIDANGLGIGLIDFMTLSQIDPETGDEFPPFGIEGGTFEGVMDFYKDVNRNPLSEKGAMYLIKANAPINSTAHSNLQSQLSSGKINLLIEEREASVKLMDTKVGQAMSPEERAIYLKPYVQTSILRDQMSNLVETNEGVNIILKQSNQRLPKDKFSAFEYGLYYIKLQDDKNSKRRGRGLGDFMFFS